MKTFNVHEIKQIIFDMEKPYPTEIKDTSKEISILTEKFEILGYNKALVDVINKINELSH